jgi:phosphate:Na+ symporter
MVCGFVGYDPAVAGQTDRLPVVLAMFHTCFNVTNTLLLIGLIPQMERIVCWLLPEKAEPATEELRLKYIEASVIQTPEIAVLQAQKETAHFAERVRSMFGMIPQLMAEPDDKSFAHLYSQIEHEEDLADRMELEIARFLEQVSQNHLSDETKEKVRRMLREVGELESIGDACYNLARTVNRQRETAKPLPESLHQNLGALMNLCDDALLQMVTTMSGHRSEHDIRDTYRIENDINQLRQRLKNDNIRAVDDHQYDYATGTIYIDLVNGCEKLGDYVVNVVQARFGK